MPRMVARSTVHPGAAAAAAVRSSIPLNEPSRTLPASPTMMVMRLLLEAHHSDDSDGAMTRLPLALGAVMLASIGGCAQILGYSDLSPAGADAANDAASDAVVGEVEGD